MNPTQSIPQTHLVLKGECIITCKESATIKTPIPKGSSVIILYHSVKKIAIVANIDEYIGVIEEISHLSDVIKKMFQIPLNRTFQAIVCDGSNDNNPKTLEQQKTIIMALQTFNIFFQIEKLPIEDTTQLEFHVRTRTLNFVAEKDINHWLEYLQEQESLRFLEQNNQQPIPELEIRAATRSVTDLPFLCKDQLPLAPAMEREGKLNVPIILTRTPTEYRKKVISELYAFFNPDEADTILWPGYIKQGKFTDLLAILVINQNYIKFVEFILDHKLILNIDLNYVFGSSGTVRDHAKKHHNQDAIRLLDKHLKKSD